VIDTKPLQIDRKETKKAVEKILFKYRDFLITIPSYLLPKVTASYSVTPSTRTNEFHSSTEDTAIKRIEYEHERSHFLEKVHEAVNSLKDEERQIIIKKYMLHDELGYDREIAFDIGVGKTKYSEIKWNAIVRIAFALGVEIYEER
jgi:ArpU family phage transcriptional regulator